ncbi:MAG: IS982 family transposase [Chloroflexota bacterium]
MIEDFDDFCLYMYVIIDDIWKVIAPMYKRPGPEPACSDSELLTMALVGECRGWELETDLLSHWQEHRDLFPVIPSQSRFNRRRRYLHRAFNQIRQAVLEMLDLSRDPYCAIDSLPVPVVQFHLVPSSTGDWKAYGAAFGKVPSKNNMTIFGYKLHLLITLNGTILDFELAPANMPDLDAGCDILSDHTDRIVLGDKAYISEWVADTLRTFNRIELLTLPRKNQKQQVSDKFRRLFNSVRQIIETVNSQLAEQFNLEQNHAHTFLGLVTRLYTKLTAHTLCIYINRLLGRPDHLHIKSLAFPI